jgi:formylglycine-generating enzyme
MLTDHSTKLAEPALQPPDENMVWIPGGTFLMGSDKHYPEEAPSHNATVEGFWIDRYAITNEQFGRFVEATGHATLAEQAPKAEDYPGALPELLQPASVVFHKPNHKVDLRDHYGWWTYIPGANWRHPEGPESSIADRAQHPVVHIAYEDAEAYAKWAGKVLPTEAEWEFAARGSLEGADYAWGDELEPGGKQMIGNVWEWTSDWYSAHHPAAKACCGGEIPKGDREQSYDPQMPNIRIPRKVIKGGSFLCAPVYCRRYRPAARMAQPVDTSTCHVGLRLIVRPSQLSKRLGDTT